MTAEGRHQWMAIVTSPENQKNLARYKEHLAETGRGRGRLFRPGARAGARRQGGGLDRWRPARDRGRRVAAATRDGLPDVEPQRCGDAAPAARRHHALRARESRRAGTGGQLVHARKGRNQAHHERAAAPVQQVHRPRRQSRFADLQHAGDRQHEPPALHRVEPAAHVQPPPVRTGRRSDLHSAVARSGQSQSRSAGDAGHPGRRHGHARSAWWRRARAAAACARRPITTAGGTAACATPPPITTPSPS